MNGEQDMGNLYRAAINEEWEQAMGNLYKAANSMNNGRTCTFCVDN